MPTSACVPNLSKQHLLAFSISFCTFLSHVHGALIDPACLRSLSNAPPLLFSSSSSSLSTSLLPLLAPTAFLSSIYFAQHLLDSSAPADFSASLSQALVAQKSSGAEQPASGTSTCSGLGLHHLATSFWMELFDFWRMKWDTMAWCCLVPCVVWRLDPSACSLGLSSSPVFYLPLPEWFTDELWKQDEVFTEPCRVC